MKEIIFFRKNERDNWYIGREKYYLLEEQSITYENI